MQDIQFKRFHQSFQKYFLTLTPEEQAGFLLWPSVAGEVLSNEEKLYFSRIKPSGVVLFKRNFHHLDSSKKLIDDLRACYANTQDTPHNLMIAVDEEGGRVSRLPFEIKTKPVLHFVREKNKEGLRNQVLDQIKMSKDIGINCILAPVLDIYTEPANPVIGDRSFGYTAEDVCEYSSVVYNELENAGIFSCGKHFPGHGNTTTDTHLDCAINDVSKDVLMTREWIPFKYFIDKNIPMIMAAHVIVPQLKADPSVNRPDNHATRNDVPATLNSHILTDILRKELKFNGLILSDDLRMGAIKKFYEQNSQKDYLQHACIDALNAGCDILLSCHSIVEEKIIIDSISQKMQKEKDFFEMCCEKACRQAFLVSSHFNQNRE